MARYFVEMEHEVLVDDHTHDDDDDEFTNTLKKRVGLNRRYEHDVIEFIEGIHFLLEAPNGEEGEHVQNGDLPRQLLESVLPHRTPTPPAARHRAPRHHIPTTLTLTPLSATAPHPTPP